MLLYRIYGFVYQHLSLNFIKFSKVVSLYMLKIDSIV